MSRVAHHRRRLLLVLAALVIAIVSVQIAPGLGYDAWGWMTWGRELRHGTLNTLSGPSWKPLPSLIAAVICVFSAAHEPAIWLVIVRLAALVALGLSFVLARDLAERGGAGRRAALAGAALTVVLVGTSADLVKTAMYGSSEPFLLVGLLGAVLLHLRGRPVGAVAALTVAGLTRPEAWVIAGLYALFLLRERGPRTFVIAGVITVAAPLIWFGFDWAGSGTLSQSATTAGHVVAGSAATTAFPAGEVVRRLLSTLVIPGVLLAAAGSVAAVRRRDRLELVLVGGSLLWTAMIAVQAQLGLSGDRRYLVGCATLFAVVAGAGVARFLTAAEAPGGARGRAPTLRFAAITAAVLACSVLPLRSDARQISVARQIDQQRTELVRAIAAAGGAHAVLTRGTPVVNPWIQTSLAWTLNTPIPRVTAAWSSTRRTPRWSPPAVLFIAPRHYAGTRPAIPAGVQTHPLASAGRWRVLSAR